jgi:hypothetical protein
VVTGVDWRKPPILSQNPICLIAPSLVASCKQPDTWRDPGFYQASDIQNNHEKTYMIDLAQALHGGSCHVLCRLPFSPFGLF